MDLETNTDSECEVMFCVCFFCVQGNEGRLYEFIVRHFLACVSQDALGQETVVDIDIAREKFSTSGLMIIARNYLDVYPYDRWSTKVLCVCVCVKINDRLCQLTILVSLSKSQHFQLSAALRCLCGIHPSKPAVFVLAHSSV